MKHTTDAWIEDPVELSPKLVEGISEASLEPAPTDTSIAAWEAYLAYDEGVLDEAPEALAAYLDHQTHLDV